MTEQKVMNYYLCEYTVNDEVCEIEVEASSKEELALHLEAIGKAVIVDCDDESFEDEYDDEDDYDEYVRVVNPNFFDKLSIIGFVIKKLFS